MTTALEMLIADGKAPKVSAATVARVMKQNMCHPKQLATPTAHTQQNRYTQTMFGKLMHLSVFCFTCLKAVCKSWMKKVLQEQASQCEENRK